MLFQNLKVNVIASVEFELAYYDTAAENLSPYTPETYRVGMSNLILF